jgi:hypothetical protein
MLHRRPWQRCARENHKRSVQMRADAGSSMQHSVLSSSGQNRTRNVMHSRPSSGLRGQHTPGVALALDPLDEIDSLRSRILRS